MLTPSCLKNWPEPLGRRLYADAAGLSVPRSLNGEGRTFQVEEGEVRCNFGPTATLAKSTDDPTEDCSVRGYEDPGSHLTDR